MRLGKVNIVLLTLLTLLSTVVSAAVNTQYKTTVCGAPYLFGCEPLSASVADKQKVLGDSTVHLNLVFGPLEEVSYDATIEPGQIYLFGCKQLTADGTETNVLQQSACECDSTVHLTLSVAAPTPKDVTVAINATINEGEKFLFGCDVLTAAGPYSRKIERVGGGDSIINLTLTVNAAPVPGDITVDCNATINEGEKYLFGCDVLTAAGPYSRKIERVGGGDSIINLTLTVNAAPVPVSDTVRVQYDADINEGETYLFGCRTLTAAGEYKDTIARQGIAGDSVIILTLNVHAAPAPTSDTVRVACTADINEGEIYLFGCRTLTAAGEYKDTIARQGIAGDSVIILTLNVHAAPAPTSDTVRVQYDAEIELGERYLFGCKTYQFDETGIHVLSDTLHSDTHDSIVFVNLTVSAGGSATSDTIVGYVAEIKAGEKYLFGCKIYDTAGEYADTLSRISTIGDSIINLTLNVCATDTIFMTDPVISCGTYHWDIDNKDYTATGKYYYDFGPLYPGSQCHLFYELNLVVATPAKGTDEVTGCDSVIFRGIAYYADTVVYDTIAGGAANTCDSIVTVTISVRHHAEGSDTLEGCDTVVFKGKKYFSSTLVYDTISGGAASGCDSIVAVTITIKKSSTGEETKDTCNLYTWHGVTYTTSGEYKDTLTNAAGCDSIVTLHLTIQIPYESSLTLVSKYGDRILMINRNEINAKYGWYLDSLDLDHPEYVTWYEIDPEGNERFLKTGYYYNLPNAEPLPVGYTYYAVLAIPPTMGNCGAQGNTIRYTVPARAAAPALMPSLARPGEDIRIVYLDPTVETTIRVFTAEGKLQEVFTSSGEDTYTIKASETCGFYMVEVSNKDTRTTLRYIVR